MNTRKAADTGRKESQKRPLTPKPQELRLFVGSRAYWAVPPRTSAERSACTPATAAK